MGDQVKAEGGSYRILYVTQDKQHIIWLHALKRRLKKYQSQI